MPVRESPRKHGTTYTQRKEKSSAKDKGKVVDLEAKEGVKDIYFEGVDPISMF